MNRKLLALTLAFLAPASLVVADDTSASAPATSGGTAHIINARTVVAPTVSITAPVTTTAPTTAGTPLDFNGEIKHGAVSITPAATSAALGGTGITISSGTITDMSGTLTLTAAPAAVDIDAIAKTVQKSLVQVEWIYQDENIARERSGLGIVVSDDTVIVWGSLISESTPREYVKNLKIRLPGKNFTTVKGTLLGRTQNRLFAYIKAEKSLDAPVLDISKTAPAKLGQRIFAVAILDKTGGYETYVGGSEVKAIQRRTYTLAGTSVFGLTRANAPVYDSATGSLIGITAPSSGEEFYMRGSTGAVSRIELFDEQQSGAFFLFGDMQEYFKNIPVKPFEAPRPWIGIAASGLSGMEDTLRDLYKIPESSGIVVGSIIPGEAADTAGLHPRDIILAVNGKPFSDSPVADVMTTHFYSEIDKHKPGETIQLTVLREGKRRQIPLKLSPAPKAISDFTHIFEPKTGLVTRDLGFWDMYERRLTAETTGVVVALVKNGAPASGGQTPLRAGYIITKVNDTAVENQKQFMELVSKETENPLKKEIVFVVLGPTGESQVCRIELNK